MSADFEEKKVTDEDVIQAIRRSLETDSKGDVVQSKRNTVKALDNDPVFHGAIRYNMLAGQIDIVKEVNWKKRYPAYDDDDRAQLYLYMEKYGITNENNIDNAVRVLAKNNEFNPVIDKLESLQWDGTERIRHVLHHFLGVEDSELNYVVWKTFLMGALHRIYYPGCKFEMMLCLVGSQGIGKSSFFKFLAMNPDWFTDDLKNLGSEKIYESLGGCWIVEMAEMIGTTGAKNVEEVKAFISREKDRYRTPYDRHPKLHPRMCVFAGTTNRQRFLPLDRTGNRRFYPMQTNEEEAETHILADEAVSKEYMEQLWAEALEIYKSGDWSLKIPDEYEKQMNERRVDYMAEDTLTGTIQSYLDDLDTPYVCTKMIYNECYKMSGDPDTKTKNEINSVMNNSIRGWEKGPQHRFQQYGQQRSWMKSIEPDEEDKNVNGDVNRGVNEPDKNVIRELKEQGFTGIPKQLRLPKM